MKKLLFFALMATNVSVFAQTNESVTMGASYANDVYYSFANGTVKTESHSNWHLAFTTKIVDASVLINEGIGVELYVASSDTSDWATLDTTGMAWNALHNSPKTWTEGAFNDGAGNHPDYGWGTYNNITHNVIASKIFVLKLPNGDYKKMIIDRMVTNGNFEFRMANLDGTAAISKTLSKSAYSTKNFFYYDVVADMVVDREPATATWDLLFTRYLEEVIPGSWYPVTGVLINNSVTGAKAEMVDTNTVDWNNYTQTDSISIVGSNWKSFNNTTFQWVLDDSLAYFVAAKDGNLYKMVFKGFAGSSTGEIIFSTSVASSIGIDEADISTVSVYPNPTRGFVNIATTSEEKASVEIIGLNGAIIQTTILENGAGKINLQALKSGLYLVRVIQNANVNVSRIIVQ